MTAANELMRSGGGGPPVILLVEDNLHNRRIFQGVLVHAGFQVYEAEDGGQALELAAQKRPDLILMDLSIPVVDGWECTRRLKADADTKSIPIIALTAHAMRGDEDRARAAGCDGYLSKPISPKRVVEEVKRVLRLPLIAADRVAPPMKLLLCTSDPSLGRQLEQAATAHGWPVTAVAGGDALLVAEMAPLVVVDGRDRDAGGVEALCRALAALPSPPLMVLALLPRAATPRDVLAAGADDLAFLPIDDETLELRLLSLERAVINNRKNAVRVQARLALSDRMVSVGTLAAGVAHEINNPLAYLTANLRYISEELTQFSGTAPDQRAREMLEAIRDAQEGAERVRLIVRDLRTFSRGDEEHVPGGDGGIDVAHAIDSAVSLAWNEIRHRARFVKDFGEVPHVDANEGRLAQVFLNLMVNAAQAIPEGEADKNEIRVTTRTDAAGRAVIDVRDTGEGIAPENLSRIFDPFFTTRRVGLGSGLGLCICHGIVTGLGGEISVESEKGKGTLVRVTLPAALPPRTPATPVDSAGSSRRARVLVIDDEPLILSSVKRLLAPDHDVTAVPSARDALARLTAGERFDVILCDLMMPETTGMDLHASLLASSPGQAEKMVFLTGGAFTTRASTFLDAVPNARLEKPFDGQMLRALIKKLMG